MEKPWNMETLKRDIEELIVRFRQNIENQRLLNNLESRVAALESENESLRSQVPEA